MAKDEGELPDFDELDLPGGDLTEALPSDTAPPADCETAPPGDEGPPPEPEKDEAAKQPTKRKKTRKKKEKKEDREEGEVEEKAGRLLEAIGKTSPYTVMLGMALLAIMIAIFCLFRELGRYNYDIKAEQVNRPSATVPADQFGPASTTEAA